MPRQGKHYVSHSVPSGAQDQRREPDLGDPWLCHFLAVGGGCHLASPSLPPRLYIGVNWGNEDYSF